MRRAHAPVLAPIAASAQLSEHGTKPVTILGESFVLYRDRSGRLGLVEERCPHRRGGMVFGIPEETGIRCAYHGWLFDETGRCLEQPYEAIVDPANAFKDKVRIKAYPVEELGGLIFVYLGPEPAPLLPRWDFFTAEDVVREIGWAIIPCNWLQSCCRRIRGESLCLKCRCRRLATRERCLGSC